MKKILLLIFISVLFSQCKHTNNYLLTNKKWIIYSIIDTKEGRKDIIKLYNKSENILTLEFKDNGILYISGTNEGKSTATVWAWDGNKKIRIYKGNYKGLFFVSELSLKELILTKYDGSINFKFLCFKHPDGKWDTKEHVKTMNQW